ncbi:hypothetical protein LAZ67_9001601, partial [Cordylochernes scorpioides]
MELCTPLLKNNCNLEKYAADGFHISLIWTKNLTSCKTPPLTISFLGLLKKELKGKRFDSDEDVQKVVQDFFHAVPKSAYKEGIYKLPERWRRCIESQVVGLDDVGDVVLESRQQADQPVRVGCSEEIVQIPDVVVEQVLPVFGCHIARFSKAEAERGEELLTNCGGGEEGGSWPPRPVASRVLRHVNQGSILAHQLVLCRAGTAPEVLEDGFDGGEGDIALIIRQTLDGALVAGELVLGRAVLGAAELAETGVFLLCTPTVS